MNKVSNISFGSTYTVRAKDNNEESYWGVCGYPKELDENIKLAAGYTPGKEYTTMAIDDKYDKMVESYFKQNNIVFTKKTNEELFNPDNIKKRIRNANVKYPSDRYLPTTVNINTEKFEDLFKKSWQYIGDKETMQNDSRYNGVKDYLKLNLPIDAPEVFITEHDKFTEITFQDGRHRYACFRDLGMKIIPVSMNAQTYKMAEKYGLLG